MTRSEIKKHLCSVETVNFHLENGTSVPEHFHVTEVGIVSRHFIDCGGTVREEKAANFQLLDANDFTHRLKPDKFLSIIALSERIFGREDLEIEVEYQSETIGRYNLGFDGHNFLLMSKKTACLAKESCGNPRKKIQLPVLEPCCASNGNGC